MSMDRERESFVRPGGVLPPGPWIAPAVPISCRDNIFVVVEKQIDGIEGARERDVEIIRHAIAALTLHRTEVAIWDELAIREEAAERDGLAPETWRERREELLGEALGLGLRIDRTAAALAQLTAATPLGFYGKALVYMAREQADADTATDGLRALRLSMLRDGLAIDAAEMGERADG